MISCDFSDFFGENIDRSKGKLKNCLDTSLCNKIYDDIQETNSIVNLNDTINYIEELNNCDTTISTMCVVHLINAIKNDTLNTLNLLKEENIRTLISYLSDPQKIYYSLALLTYIDFFTDKFCDIYYNDEFVAYIFENICFFGNKDMRLLYILFSNMINEKKSFVKSLISNNDIYNFLDKTKYKTHHYYRLLCLILINIPASDKIFALILEKIRCCLISSYNNSTKLTFDFIIDAISILSKKDSYSTVLIDYMSKSDLLENIFNIALLGLDRISNHSLDILINFFEKTKELFDTDKIKSLLKLVKSHDGITRIQLLTLIKLIFESNIFLNETCALFEKILIKSYKFFDYKEKILLFDIISYLSSVDIHLNVPIECLSDVVDYMLYGDKALDLSHFIYKKLLKDNMLDTISTDLKNYILNISKNDENLSHSEFQSIIDLIV